MPVGTVTLEGELDIPSAAQGVVIFAHGSGSSRHSPRNQLVARALREAGLATLLFDLLTREEEAVDIRTRHLRFDIDLLARRLVDATRWLVQQRDSQHLRPGYFGASTGGGAALVAAAELGKAIGAVVSRGGRPDLAGEALRRVTCPILLIVGANDEPVIELTRAAYGLLRCEKEVQIVPGASHLFEEPGKLEQVAELAAGWFTRHLSARVTAARGA